MAWLGCNVYVSEGRNLQLLRQLEALAQSSRGVALVNTFFDAPYHRSSFTLVSHESSALAAGALALARAALQAIDFRRHEASHPRLGAVDHISCHPLTADTSLAIAAEAAAGMARELGRQPGVPVFTYGAAHPEGRRLEQLRRQLGYFQGAAAGRWRGSLPDAPLALHPEFGPPAPPPAMGLVCIGALPWVVNFNVLLDTTDAAVAARIAKGVSERGDGLAAVQAMALPHERGIEVACNLLDASRSSPDAVLELTRELAVAAGVAVVDAYRIGKSEEEMVAQAAQLLKHSD